MEELLDASPEIRVLATSREALALEGEQAWPVTSLALPRTYEEEAAAMRLLLDRVRELRPDFAVRDDDRAHLVDICRRLDGLPLALELAAARLAHLSPADVADRLHDRFRLLTGGRRRTERQQTLRATIDWSYDLLDKDERAVMRRLSVFAGGAPLQAIEAVAAHGLDEADTIDLLGRLVARSLVVADTVGPATRYRLLETIRLYGEDKLVEAGEAQDVRSRHRDWYLAWLESFSWDLRLVSPAVAAQARVEYDNLRLALTWSADEGRDDLVARLFMGLTGACVLPGYVDDLDPWRELLATAELPSTVAATPTDAAVGIGIGEAIEETQGRFERRMLSPVLVPGQLDRFGELVERPGHDLTVSRPPGAFLRMSPGTGLTSPRRLNSPMDEPSEIRRTR